MPTARLGAEAAWNVYCRDRIGLLYKPGFTFSKPRFQITADASFIELLGFDPTGVYDRYIVKCNAPAPAGPGVNRPYGFWVERTPPIPPETLRTQARARINPPLPAPGGAPSLDDATFAQFETWLWVDDATGVLDASATQGLVTVTVTATPIDLRWSLGDGETLSCAYPGRPWTLEIDREGTWCSHTYTSSSIDEPGGVYNASVTVTWEFSWWINARPQGSFGTFDATAEFPVRVEEIQALETN